MKKVIIHALSLCLVLTIIFACGNNASKTEDSKKDTAATTQTKNDSTVEESQKPPVSGDVQLKLPEGFTAIEVTPGIGGARHLVVNSNGDIYVKLSNPKNGKGIMVLKDKNGDGIADEHFRFRRLWRHGHWY